MDKAKVFKDYFVSSQNTVLIPNEEFGKRKFINVGINRSITLSRIEEIIRNHTDKMRAANKQWIHPADALIKGHILYIVKFYGECEVEAPKGTDVVKDAIRKRKFNKTLQKTEGQRTQKVELVISVDGVTIQEAKTKIVKHQYPLHRISYCADDKSDRRMFTFIAKAFDSNKHFCYVFASDKNAEEITLTIGQAFDLAYRRFLDTQGKDLDTKKQQIILQKKVEALEKENEQLKIRIRELEMLKDSVGTENYKQCKQSGSLKLSSSGKETENVFFDSSTPMQGTVTNGSSQSPHNPLSPGIISPPPPSARSRKSVNLSISSSATQQQAPPSQPDVNSELASLFMSSADIQTNSQRTLLSCNNNNVLNPFNSPRDAPDPFGMPSFTPTPVLQADKDFLDLEAGFSEGLSFGTGDFGMHEFDPLSPNISNC